MIYNYIIENYKVGQPIFINELSSSSNDYLRQEMKKLVDEGKLERFQNGVYYLPYTTILGTKGKISFLNYLEKRFLSNGNEAVGYYTGLQLANLYGFTTQNSAVYEICTNEATTKQRRLNVDGNKIIIYKPVVKISQDNIKELQFLDLMVNIDKYSELVGDKLKEKIKKYIVDNNLNFEIIKKYLPLYPDRIYRNLYYGGVMNELVCW